MSKPKVKKPLHQPIPELVKALAMPVEKRRKARNKICMTGTTMEMGAMLPSR